MNAHASNDPTRSDGASERANSMLLLRGWLPRGATVLVTTLHTSRSGLELVVGCWALHIPEWVALYEAKEALVLARCGAAVSAESVDAAVRALNATAARPRTIRLFGHAARVLGRRADLDRGGVVFRGGNYSATHELVHDLGVALYGDAQAFECEEL